MKVMAKTLPPMHPGEVLREEFLVPFPSYAFIAPFTAAAAIGSERTRGRRTLKIALPSAGATAAIAGSPTRRLFAVPTGQWIALE
jgi:antitoxin HigA-1